MIEGALPSGVVQSAVYKTAASSLASVVCSGDRNSEFRLPKSRFYLNYLLEQGMGAYF